jgi:hypothetical protein
MRKMHLIAGIVSVIGVSTLIVINCSKSSTPYSPPPTPSAPYCAQWMTAGMGTDILNLRSDATFSDINWGSGTVGDTTNGFYAAKGTYSFTPDSAGDQIHGMLHLHYTHDYNSSTDQWESSTPAFDENDTCIVDTVSAPKTLSLDGWVHQYYGAATTIPATL